jgi:hypothetical protein
LVPGRAAKIGKLGGQQNRSVLAHDSSEPIAIPETVSDVRHLLAEAIALTREGRMNPKVATALSYMCMAQLKTIEAVDFDRRLRALEEFCRRADELDLAQAPRPPEPTPEECDRAVEADLG